MDRKDFFKSVCRYGACGCAGMMLLSSRTLFAEDIIPEDDEKEDWRIDFMQNRIAGLVNGMEAELEVETINSLLENMGRHCAKERREANLKFEGNVDAYLETIGSWTDKTEHNKEKGYIRIVGKESESCFCPFVDSSKMPKAFCHCSKGYQKETFETILGQTVEVNIDSSVLFGGDRCSFSIRYQG